jgi:hypothetical protein
MPRGRPAASFKREKKEENNLIIGKVKLSRDRLIKNIDNFQGFEYIYSEY